MAIAKLDFNRGQVANPLDSIGDDLLKYGTSLHQQEKDRLAAARQDELLGMQKAEYQMKVDAVAQAAKEKEAANRYADVLGAATSGNVIGVPDQKILGEQVAAMSEKAQAAYASGNKGLGDEIVAQQESYINSVLPKMTKAYEASPEAQLQVLRGTNPLGGTGDLAPQTRLALLKEAEAPIEKTLDRTATHDLRLKEIEEQHKNARLLEGIRTANAFKEADYKAEAEKKHATFINRDGKTYGTYEDWKKSPGNWATIDDTYKVAQTAAVLTPKPDNNVDIFKDENGKHHYLKKSVDTVIPEGWTKVSGNGGSDGGGSTSSKGKAANDLLSNIAKDAPLMGFWGTGDAVQAQETAAWALAANIPAETVQQAFDRAKIAGSGLLGDRKFAPEHLSIGDTPLTIKTSDGKTVEAGKYITAAKNLGATLEITDKGPKIKLPAGVDNAKILKEVTSGTTTPAVNEVLGAPGASTTSAVLPAPAQPQPSIYGQGQDLAAKIRTEQDRLVNSYDPALPNKQWLANTKAEIYKLRQSLGGDEFERRYPGVAANLKLY